MEREYLVSTLAKHIEALRINDRSDFTIDAKLEFLKLLSEEFSLLMHNLDDLHKVMLAKQLLGFPYARRVESKWNPMYQFHSFSNSQFTTAERISSELKKGVPAKNIQLSLEDALYQQEVLYTALMDLLQACCWYRVSNQPKERIRERVYSKEVLR